MKKPWTLLSSTLALTLFLTACGEDSGGDASKEQTSEQTTENETATDAEDKEEENNESAEQEPSASENAEKQQHEDTSNEDGESGAEEASTTNTSSGSDSTEEEAAANETNATVTNVVDGDTIDVEYEGSEERIRLILVDTPETKHPQMGVQPFGPEASEFTTSTLAGEDVRLELGVEERDYYGRLLAYVFVDGENFNQQLIEEGLARVAVYPPNTGYLDEFEAAEEKARSAGTGIWSIEDYVTSDGYEEQSDDESSSNDSSSDDSEESPEDVYYENCDAARDAGASPVREGDPGYGGHLDRDGDGVGCET